MSWTTTSPCSAASRVLLKRATTVSPTQTLFSPASHPTAKPSAPAAFTLPPIKTLPDQLNAVGKTWRGYMENMGNDPTRESATCGHPALNTIDHTQSAEGPS